MKKKEASIFDPLTRWITASEAAHILTLKLGRKIRPDYIHKIKEITRKRIHSNLHLYLRSDVEQVMIRAKSA